MPIQVQIADNIDEQKWIDFCQSTGADYHGFSWAWRNILYDTFGHQPYYLLAYESGLNSATSEHMRVCGVLPLFFVRSPLFGKALISLPYLNGGGILSRSKETFDALLDRAVVLSQELQVNYLELRHRAPLLPEYETPRLQSRSHKVAMILPLLQDTTELFSRFSSKLRSQIRRPEKAGLTTKVSLAFGENNGNTEELLTTFYQVFARNMRDLGTPVYPKSLFINAVKSFGKSARIISVFLDHQPVASAITLGLNGNVEILWASSIKQFNHLSPNMLLYWHAIKQAAEDGYQQFDFGRSSPDSGTYRFKEQWGAKPKPLHWYYSLQSGTLPDINPKSAKFRILVKAWQQLPLAVTNVLGPWLTKGLP